MQETTALNDVTKSRNRYTQGGSTEKFDTRVGWWERTVFGKHESDIIFYVDNNNERRPDLISYKMYGTPSYAWIVLQYNNIVDINEELITGTRLLLPSTARLNSTIATNSAGANRI